MKSGSTRATTWVLVTPSANPIPEGVPQGIAITAAGTVTMRGKGGDTMTIGLAIGTYGFCPTIISAATATVYALY